MTLSVLQRAAFGSFLSQTSGVQAQVDGLVSRFTDEVASPITLSALMAGGLAYRVGRIGVMGLGSSSFLRPLSIAAGLGSEVSAYELTSRSLLTLSGCLFSNPNLWRWEGQGGIRQGLLSSGITFGILKGAGSLAREQNLFFQHTLQSTAMVAGHNTTSLLGIIPPPEGSLAEQLLHAEVTNLQLAGGSSLVYSLVPGVHALERGLDASLSVQNSGNFFQDLLISRRADPVTAMGRKVSGSQSSEKNPWTLQMAAMDSKEGKGNGNGGVSPSDTDSISADQNSNLPTNAIPSPAQDLYRLLIHYYRPQSGETIPEEEIRALNSLPGAILVPTHPLLRDNFFRHLSRLRGKNLRENFDDLRDNLGDAKTLPAIYFGMLNNAMTIVMSNWGILREEMPLVEINEQLFSQPRTYPEDLGEFVENMISGIQQFSEAIQILSRVQDGTLLRGIYIGKTGFGKRGIRNGYRMFLNDVYPFLAPPLREKWGLESIPSHREMILRIWELTRGTPVFDLDKK